MDGTLFASILRKRVSLLGTTLRNRSDEYKAALVSDFASRTLPGLEKGSLRPVIETVLNLEDAQAAHELMESNANTGKILLAVAKT